MIIGNFIYDPEADTYAGSLTTLTVSRTDIRIRPNEKEGSHEPDYRIIMETASGIVELGAGWNRISERGTKFISVMLDDPTLGTPLNAALFYDNADGSATLVWNRPKPKAKAEPVKKAA